MSYNTIFSQLKKNNSKVHPEEFSPIIKFSPSFSPNKKLSEYLLDSETFSNNNFVINNELKQKYDRFVCIKCKTLCVSNQTNIDFIHPFLRQGILEVEFISEVLYYIFTNSTLDQNIKTIICRDFRKILSYCNVGNKEEGIFISNEFANSFNYEFS